MDNEVVRLGALREDTVPFSRVFWKEPPFGLPAVPEMEDADHPGLSFDPRSSSAHLAQRTDVLVVREHVMLAQPEPDPEKVRQPHHDRLASVDVPGSWVVSGNVPDDGFVKECRDPREVTGTQGVGGLPVGRCVRMLWVHCATVRVCRFDHPSITTTVDPTTLRRR